MIATIRGELFYKGLTRAVVDVGGVGYELFLSLRSVEKLPSLGSEVFFHVYTSVREDAITLFGFREYEEKEMFLLLTSVSGVGPKLALNILSGISPSELARAISFKDIKRLTVLSGVGKKTGERLCMELKDKVGFAAGDEPGFVPGTAPSEASPDGGMGADVISGLVNLGYPPLKAQQALAAVRARYSPEEISAMRVEELLRVTLRSLA